MKSRSKKTINRYTVPLLVVLAATLLILSTFLKDETDALAGCKARYMDNTRASFGETEESMIFCMKEKGYVLKPHDECSATKSSPNTDKDYDTPACYQSAPSGH